MARSSALINEDSWNGFGEGEQRRGGGAELFDLVIVGAGGTKAGLSGRKQRSVN